MGEITKDGGTAIGNMKIAIAGDLLRHIHRSDLLSTRERLWMAHSPTRDIFPEVTRRICTGSNIIFSWNRPIVNRVDGINIRDHAPHRLEANHCAISRIGDTRSMRSRSFGIIERNLSARFAGRSQCHRS